jgi:hypothetical protein
MVPPSLSKPPLRDRGAVRCAECGAVAHGIPVGWQAYLAGGYEDEPIEIVTYCPVCAERETGDAA